ncbi:MAG: AgmX/PglI C-terminal domain-containing protein [bacterium]
MRHALLEVTVAWGRTILDVHHLHMGEAFALGGDSPYGGVDDVVPPGQTLVLARMEPEGARVWLPPGVGGYYQAGSEITPLPGNQTRTLLLGKEGIVRAEAGALTLYFARVEPAAHPGRRAFAGMFGDLRSLAGAAVLHLAVVLIAIAAPPNREALSIDRFDGNDRFIPILLVPTDSQEKDLFTTPERGDEGGGDQLPEVDSDTPSGSEREPTAPRAQRPAPTRAQRLDTARAAASELKNVLDDSGMFGPGADPLGQTAAGALAGMGGGDGGRGAGLGGGGSGDPFGGPVGPGGPRGPGRSLGPGAYRTRPGRPGPVTGIPGREPGQKVPKVIPREPVVEDGLSREEVQRVVRLKKAEYRACYERELQSRRDLEGKLTMKWVVGPDGKVLAASVVDSTLASDEVGACIGRAIKRWQFPRPRGGGVVTVRYPFLFRAS